ncbi:hypothetical protein [Clostridium rectalis]|nr:hypothetical protein [Clostridium rectalis]
MKCMKKLYKTNFRGLNRKDKICISGLIVLTFIRGICIGMYLNEK